MADLTIKQKKEWARECYFRDNLTQKEIAEKVGLSRQTINKMASDENWEGRKAGITLTREEIVKGWYRQAAELNNEIMAREPGKRHPTNAEVDRQLKIATAIKKLEDEAGIADVISVGSRFIKFIRTVDFEQAKEITRLFDAFIKTLL